jgi:hypothetical protein
LLSLQLQIEPQKCSCAQNEARLYPKQPAPPHFITTRAWSNPGSSCSEGRVNLWLTDVETANLLTTVSKSSNMDTETKYFHHDKLRGTVEALASRTGSGPELSPKHMSLLMLLLGNVFADGLPEPLWRPRTSFTVLVRRRFVTDSSALAWRSRRYKVDIGTTLSTPISPP